MKSAQWPKAGMSGALTAPLGLADFEAEIVFIIAVDWRWAE